MARYYLEWVIFPILILYHLYLAPYTKVEESFNIQAVHDILAYGIPTDNVRNRFQAEYDHFSFPGSVPRTFVGALVLAGTSRPFIWLDPRVDRQVLVRTILGLFNAFALAVYANGVANAFGRTTGVWYTLFQASQFHVIYYASRTLPNTFAFGICTLALRFLLPDKAKLADSSRRSKHYRLALYLITVAGIIFRSELAVLLFTITSYLYLTNQISLRREILPAGLAASLISFPLTVFIDSYFWQQFPLWPELASFNYNLVSGKSSDWGVLPMYYYFYSSIPRLLLNPLTYTICIPFALSRPAFRRPVTSILLPSLNYIVLYSLLPHKEWRFIIYAIPPLTTVAALGASGIWLRRTRTPLYRLLSIILVASVVMTFFISNFVLLPISSLNYPGAQALNRLHGLAHGEKKIIAVHTDNLACQTGVTRFLEKPPPQSLMFNPSGRIETLWVYDKMEGDKLLTPSFWARFDYVLAERPEKVIGAWEVFDTVEGFAGVEILKEGEEGWIETMLKKWSTENGSVKTKELLVSACLGMEDLVRKHVTKGRWVGIKMEPKIRVLKKARTTPRIDASQA